MNNNNVTQEDINLINAFEEFMNNRTESTETYEDNLVEAFNWDSETAINFRIEQLINYYSAAEVIACFTVTINNITSRNEQLQLHITNLINTYSFEEILFYNKELNVLSKQYTA